jgi:hypothetical protein
VWERKKEMRGEGQIFLERTIGAGDTVAVSKADNLRKVKTQKKGELEVFAHFSLD